MMHSHTSLRGENTPDHQIFADTFDEDTGGMEGHGEEAEERRELTGTSFQYQRVGHCQRRTATEGQQIEKDREMENRSTGRGIKPQVEELDKQGKGLW